MYGKPTLPPKALYDQINVDYTSLRQTDNFVQIEKHENVSIAKGTPENFNSRRLGQRSITFLNLILVIDFEFIIR